jgi:hypothetical protein
MADCEPRVQQVGNELISSLSFGAVIHGYPPIPSFNEVTWTRYPQGTGHITAHRDPEAYGGVIAIFTLFGGAAFQVIDTEIGTQWTTEPGDVVVLRGHAWPTSDAKCPGHAVEAPTESDRMIMTLCFNSPGAGGGYDV